jgi:hypothetical protein
MTVIPVDPLVANDLFVSQAITLVTPWLIFLLAGFVAHLLIRIYAKDSGRTTEEARDLCINVWIFMALIFFPVWVVYSRVW